MTNLESKRVKRQMSELNFTVLKSQEEAVMNFLNKMYWNFEESNGTIYCIGGKRYDLNRVSINNKGVVIVTT